MSETVEEGVEEEDYVRVPTGHYNSLVDAADLGFEVLVQRRRDLKDLALRMPSYPERDSMKMAPQAEALLDGMPLSREDVQRLERSVHERIQRLAQALNERLHRQRYH
jgi:hypothetical protein